MSLQGLTDNPNNDPSWQIYPPPPPPVWVEDPPSSQCALNINESCAVDKLFWAGGEQSHMESRRKPGENIGEDFTFDEVEIPEADEKVFKMDNNGVYQVYNNRKGMYLSIWE